ncbi:tetratricopeptide repeat protein [Corallibacter sp.]|uniref:tetratricopeptide repeat protein n=1 Tax=Corallibacter sp. TaxID=2038084 RepID=UPI003A8D85F6
MRHILTLLLLFVSVAVFSQAQALKLNDSAMSFYKTDSKLAIALLEESLTKASNDKDIAIIKNNLGIVYRDLGEFEKSKALSSEAILKTQDSITLASAYNNIGVTNRNLGLYDTSLEYYLKALAIYEEKQMAKEIATTSNNIGLVYSYSGINDKAITYHLKAKAAFEKLDDKKGISEVYNNIAIIYANDGNLKEALDYFKHSLNIEYALQDKKGIAESTNNVGAVYYYLEEIDSALVYFQKSVIVEKSIGNVVGVGASYNNIAQVLIEKNRASEAKKYIDSAYQYSRKYKTVSDIEASLMNYSEYYEAKSDSKKALEYYKKYTAFKDSILNLDTNSKISELEIQYQTEKKEKEILQQRADLAEKELHINTKNTQIIGLAILAIVLSVLGYLLYKQQKLRNKQLQKESELKEALTKIETQNRLQEQRLTISRDLHDNIGAQLTFIISSLDNLKYGFTLPEKLGSKLKTISEFTTATIYELRDTIWAMNKSEISFEDLQSRISNFIDKANHASDMVNFSFKVDESLSNTLVFSSVEGMNIYRIIQEAVNNALKYAHAKNIQISFQKENKNLVLTVKDDGVGFDQNTIELGNGLNNMKKRAHEIQASFTLKTSPQQGATIVIQKEINT